MGGDEVHGQMILVAVIQEIGDPDGTPRNGEGIEGFAGGFRFLEGILIHVEVAGGRTADAQLGIDGLDGLNGHVVQLEIFLLGSAAKE